MQLSDRIGRRIKLQDLHVFATVVQAGSMGKAADLLNTSQPNISRSIADLEYAIGTRLLDRYRRGIEPTQYGRLLLNCALAAFDDLRQGVKDIEFLADPAGGEVRIGSIIPLAASFVSAVIDRLSRRYPRIVFYVVAHQQEELHRELSERNLDLLIAWRPAPFTDDRQSFDFLFDDSYVVVAGPQNRWIRRRRIQLSELAGEAWALPPPETVLGTAAAKAFRAGGLAYPRAAVLAMPDEVRATLLGGGRFLTIFPSSALTLHPQLKVLPVEMHPARLPVGIVTLRNRTLGGAAQLFIEAARDYAKSLPKNKR